MSNIKKALETAIEALELRNKLVTVDESNKSVKAIQQCKSAIAELDNSEPVLYAVEGYKKALEIHNGATLCTGKPTDLHKLPLFTHPQQHEWVGLSGDEITVIGVSHQSLHQVARAIEQKLKEKNS